MELGREFKIKKRDDYFYVVNKLFGYFPIYLFYVSDEYINNDTVKPKWKFIYGKFSPKKFKNENDASEYILVVLCDIGSLL
jgi:hypothetical protein